VKTLGPWAQSIMLGWAVLLGIAYVVERPLLQWTAPLFGAVWMATAHLALDCLTMAAAGFVAGRSNRSHAVVSASVFAATISFWDFGPLLALNVPALLRVGWDAAQDSRFLDSLVTIVETQGVLFGCLLVGAMLSRPRVKPISIAGGVE
jgi:hypothetical protein